MYNKYLKYKNKYLSLKILGGMFQEPDDEVNVNVNVIVCLPNGEERPITISKEEELVPAIARELGVRPTQIIVSFIDNVVGLGLTAEDCGIVNNSRLTITFIVDEIKTKAQFRNHVLPNMMELNQHLDPDEIMYRVTTLNGAEDENIQNINFMNFDINGLPEIFGNMIVTGDMNLSYNNFTTLPDSLGNIKVFGNLNLSKNNFTTLPETLVNITIHGHLVISMSQFRNFPDIIGKIKSGKDAIFR
jgi:hypothetical protein